MASIDQRFTESGQQNDAINAQHINSQAKRIALILIGLAVFLTALDQTVVITVLRPIGRTINVSVEDPDNIPSLSWLVSGYLLGYIIMMPLMGRISDLWGRRRILIGVLAFFAFGSWLCVESSNLANFYQLPAIPWLGVDDTHPILSWLVIARFIQAVGGGAVVPIAIAAIGDLFGSTQRILALGLIGGITEAGSALGPLYGALISDRWPVTTNDFPDRWEWIFILNIPFIVLIILFLLFGWPRTSLVVSPQISWRERLQIDVLGALALGASVLCLGLGLGQTAGIATNINQIRNTQNNPLLLVIAVLLFVLFLFIESRVEHPLIDLNLFRFRAYSASIIYNLLMGMTLIIALVNVTLFFLGTKGASEMEVGLALLRLTICIPFGALLGGWLTARTDCRIVGISGSLSIALGFLLMHFWTRDTNEVMITLAMVIAGIGFGLIISPVSTTALNTASPERFGMAAALVTAMRMVGMIFGLSVLSSWEPERYQQLNKSIPPIKDINNPDQVTAFSNAILQVMTQVFSEFFLVGAILALLAVIPALFLWRPKPGEKAEITTFSMGL
jgi:MFS family permease